MTHSRIALAVLAAATILTLTAPADARRATKAHAGAMPVFDVAAVPAYPTAEMPGHTGHAARGGATKASRTGDRSAREAGASQEGSNGGSVVVRSAKTGATARVSPKWSRVFQAYVDDLEAHGAVIHYMGGIRPGRCSPASQHPCGSALDVCQDYRGHVSGARDCNLPGPVEMAAIAARHGLSEGSTWCGSPDYGHAQAIPTGTTCTARGTFGPHKHRLASRSAGRL